MKQTTRWVQLEERSTLWGMRLPRKNREQAIVQTIQRYAERLQHYCLKAPLQWFNFFDFWHVDNNDE